jgi:uncharacterized protein
VCDCTGGTPVIEGYASVFSTPTTIAGSFRVVVRPGCFARAIREKQGVVALREHDMTHVIGRTTNRTLDLMEDAHGLHFRATLPKTQDAKDLLQLVKDNYVNQASFGFLAVRQNWIDPDDVYANEDEDDLPLRELLDCDLKDVSVCAYGAYPTTSVSAPDVRSILFPEGLPAVIAAHQRVRTLN